MLVFVKLIFHLDIALIRFPEGKVFNFQDGGTIQPITNFCEMSNEELVKSKEKVTVSGWGMTENGACSDVLMIAEQTPRPTTATNDNDIVYDGQRILQFNKESTHWIGIGQGDSGGKTMFLYVLYGIVHHCKGCDINKY